eukprot:5688392-Pyramimonas_sp.AAC.1
MAGAARIQVLEWRRAVLARLAHARQIAWPERPMPTLTGRRGNVATSSMTSQVRAHWASEVDAQE